MKYKCPFCDARQKHIDNLVAHCWLQHLGLDGSHCVCGKIIFSRAGMIHHIFGQWSVCSNKKNYLLFCNHINDAVMGAVDSEDHNG